MNSFSYMKKLSAYFFNNRCNVGSYPNSPEILIDFKQCNGNIDYYTVTLPMSKKIFYPVRKVRIIKEYYTPRFKRDNSPDSCIPALPNLTQSVTTDTFSQRSFFWLRYKCKCINPVTMCRGTVLQVLIYQQNLAPNSFT